MHLRVYCVFGSSCLGFKLDFSPAVFTGPLKPRHQEHSRQGQMFFRLKKTPAVGCFVGYRVSGVE